jgi:flavoprotein
MDRWNVNVDIFLQINKQKSSLRITVFNVSDKIESMIKKFNFWRSLIERRQPEVFETLHSFLSENDWRLSRGMSKKISQHLQG